MKTKRNNKQNILRFGVGAGLVLAGIVLGVIITSSVQTVSDNKKQQKYSLLADRILQGSDKDRTVSFTDLRGKLNDYISSANLPQNGYSVYFEYLPTGTSIGFSESNTLVGASLLKVPFAIQYYKAVEDGVLTPTDTVQLKSNHLDDTYGMLYKKGAGYTITLGELTHIMLTDSDNTALRALADALDEKAGLNTIPKVFNFVDLNYSSSTEGTTLIGASAYSSILKCLYFACYTNKQNSQEILTLLTNTSFNDRLKRYIPQDDMPLIAHKIGSFDQTTQSDCGIFYQPQKPYILCVMVNGDDTTASQHIGKMSVIVHEYITNLTK